MFSHRTKKRMAFLIGSCVALATSASARDVVLPKPDTVLNRLHVQLRWPALEGIVSEYKVEITDNFGNRIVRKTASDLPRLIVTEGLDFGRTYRWRVSALVGLPVPAPGPARAPSLRVFQPIRRFFTKAVVFDDNDNDELPVFDTIVPAGPSTQPGYVMFTIARKSSDLGHIVVFDGDGKLVMHWNSRTGSSAGDLRQLDNGRFFYQDTIPVDIGGGQELPCRTAVEATLDGGVVWQSPTDQCGILPPPPIIRVGVHHEAFPMPRNAPRGANYLLLEYDNRFISYTDTVHDGAVYNNQHWMGDVANEYDRHTSEIVNTWTTFDWISLDDHLPSDHDGNVGGVGGDWNHANAIVYDNQRGRAWMSLREQSRLVAIDWEANPPVNEFQMGDDSIVGSALYPGPFPGGTVDFGDNFFSFQHAPQVQPNGNLVVYNNGNYIEPYNPLDLSDRRTTAIEIAFDDADNPTSAMVVDSLNLMQEDLATEAFAPFVGDADRLPNGNTMTVDGPRANVMELDPAGNVVWFVDAGPPFIPNAAGVLIYRVSKLDAVHVDAPSDTDGDWDVDLHDMAGLQTEFTGSGASSLGFPAVLSDHDGDDDVDNADVAEFTYWMTGPAR